VSLRRDSEGLYRSPLLEAEPWLEHAFGTAAAMPPDGFLALRQVHSVRVVDAGEWTEDLEADGLLASRPGQRVAVKTADCVPILIACPERHAAAAVHAGWRGTVAGAAAEGVRALQERYGCRPESLKAAFGPSIGPCCFEVGPEVGVLFRDLFPERDGWEGRTRIDLREANRRILVRAGVLPERISTEAPCTCCGGAEFYSWRRDRKKGERMFAVIGIRK
jgi:YfiH family protein